MKVQEKLLKKNISPTVQRVKIIEFLDKNRIHPSVDEIYEALSPDLATLSKATVYNTLKLLEESKLVKVINVDEIETRFDICTKDHGHFLCEKCGKIYDFEIVDKIEIPKELKDFTILNEEISYKGICKKCNNINRKDKNGNTKKHS